MTTELILEAFNMAVAKRKITPGLILHSDRGVQYRATEYQDALSKHKITPSMSRKGNCWECVACPRVQRSNGIFLWTDESRAYLC